MKNIILLIAIAPLSIFAQKVKVENDTVYKDDVPYCIILKQGEALAPIYSIRTLSNVEVATMKQDDAVPVSEQNVAYARITFTGSGAIAHFSNGIPLVKRLAKALVESDVITNNAINPEGEKRFLSLYPNKLVNQPTVIVNVNTNSPDYTPVQRNKFGTVIAMNGMLAQNRTDIGTYSTTKNMSGGKSLATTSYKLPNGVQCASATYDNIGAKNATVTTMRDNVTRTITITNSANCEEEIANWLSTNGYL